MALVSTPEKRDGCRTRSADTSLRARRRHRTAVPRRHWLSWADPLSSDRGLFISQGCLVYTTSSYFLAADYLQTARRLSMLDSGIYTAIPFLVSTMVGIVANSVGDQLLTAEAVRGGKRRYLVALSLLFTAAGPLIPFVQSLAAVIALITIAVSAAHVGPAANGALVGDLLRSPGDAGRAFPFLVLGGDTFGLLAPILTGYIVAGTAGFNAAFVVAGALALVGAVASLVFVRGTLGDHVRPSRATTSRQLKTTAPTMIACRDFRSYLLQP